MHLIQSRFLVRWEVWHDEDPEPARVDWILYRQRPQPVPGARCRPFYTLVLDLSQEPEELLRQMSKTAAYHIRRARDKDKATCEALMPVSSEMLDQFEETYKRFAAAKGLEPLDRRLLDQLARDGALELSVARNPEGEPLVFHAYYRGAKRSCLLHTISLHQALSDSAARNAIGRANRWLFWSDILRHREQGVKIFDFGGWYPGNTDQHRLDINRFKEGFGGKIVREYNSQQTLTLKGWVVLTAARLLNWAKGIAARFRPSRKRSEPEISEPDTESVTSGKAPARGFATHSEKFS